MAAAGKYQAGVKERIAAAAALVKKEGVCGHVQNAIARGVLKESGQGRIVAGDQFFRLRLVPLAPGGTDVSDFERCTGQRLELEFAVLFAGWSRSTKWRWRQPILRKFKGRAANGQ